MSMMKTRNSKRCLAAALIAVFTPLATQAASPPLYDNFKRDYVDPEKWIGGHMNEGAVELITEIKQNGLHMRARGIGDATTTTGERANVVNRLYLRAERAETVRAFHWYARVNSTSLRVCKDTTATDSRARLRHFANWYNDGRSSGPSDFTGNVFSILGFRETSDPENSKSRVEIFANVSVCDNAVCTEASNYYIDKLGSVALGQNVALRTTWDENAQQFRFMMKKNGKAAVVKFYDYATELPHAGPPAIVDDKFPRHQLRVQAQAADCNVAASGGGRPYSMMDGTIWNVRLADTAEGY